jgi:hypothetical protein
VAIVDKAALFASRLNEEDVEVSGLGTVRVRGLSRAEAMLLQRVDDTAARERKMLALAMVDPPLTEAEVGQWQKAAPASELEPVTDAVGRLSGRLDSSPKDVVTTFRDEPGA